MKRMKRAPLCVFVTRSLWLRADVISIDTDWQMHASTSWPFSAALLQYHLTGVHFVHRSPSLRVMSKRAVFPTLILLLISARSTSEKADVWSYLARNERFAGKLKVS